MCLRHLNTHLTLSISSYSSIDRQIAKDKFTTVAKNPAIMPTNDSNLDLPTKSFKSHCRMCWAAAAIQLDVRVSFWCPGPNRLPLGSLFPSFWIFTSHWSTFWLSLLNSIKSASFSACSLRQRDGGWAYKTGKRKLFFFFHLVLKGLCAKRDSLKCWFNGLGRHNVPSWVMVAEVQNERNVWLGKGRLSSVHPRMFAIQAISQRVQTIGMKSET